MTDEYEGAIVQAYTEADIIQAFESGKQSGRVLLLRHLLNTTPSHGWISSEGEESLREALYETRETLTRLLVETLKGAWNES